jgi:hypothetical protein
MRDMSKNNFTSRFRADGLCTRNSGQWDVWDLVSAEQSVPEAEVNYFIFFAETFDQERYERIRGFRRPHHHSKLLRHKAKLGLSVGHIKELLP